MPDQNSRNCDPRTYVTIKPLPNPSSEGLKIQGQSFTLQYKGFSSREEVFKANYSRRQMQLSQQGYNAPNYKPYEELGHPLILDERKLILHTLGQDKQDSPLEKDIDKKTPEEFGFSPKPHLTTVSAPPGSAMYLKHRKRDTNNFNKVLNNTRRMLSAGQQGRGNFPNLQQKLEAKKLKQQEKLFKKMLYSELQEFMNPKDDGFKRHEELHESKSANKIRFFSTEPEEEEEVIRPFTPIHNTLLSELHQDADPEPIFRQLCAIHWLLESLTLEPSIPRRPLFTCWDIRDPGSSKMPSNISNRQKEVDAVWERFIADKAKMRSPKVPRSQLRARRLSFLSTSRMNGFSSGFTPSLGSISSLHQASDSGAPTSSDAPPEGGEDIASTVNSSLLRLNKEEDEEPLCSFMQILEKVVAESVEKDLEKEESRKYTLKRDSGQAEIVTTSLIKDEPGCSRSILQRPKSSPASHFIENKLNMCSEMREKFFEVANEADAHLHHTMEELQRRRQEVYNQKYKSLHTATNFRQAMDKMRNLYNPVMEDKAHTDTKNWFSVLLSRIPSNMKKINKIHVILEKLQSLQHEQFVRIQPKTFLGILHGLCNWELGSPDISVAIEFVWEHVTMMSGEEYTAWLQTRLGLSSKRIQSAPLQR